MLCQMGLLLKDLMMACYELRDALAIQWNYYFLCITEIGLWETRWPNGKWLVVMVSALDPG